MPRGVDPALHLKLGPGGLADVEWVAQLLQLRHAGAVPALRTTRTLAALAAAREAGLISRRGRRGRSRAAWLLATRIRDAVMLVRGRGSDALPSAPADLAVVARLLGYPPDECPGADPGLAAGRAAGQGSDGAAVLWLSLARLISRPTTAGYGVSRDPLPVGWRIDGELRALLAGR